MLMFSLSLSFCANSLVTVKKCSQTRPYVVVVVVFFLMGTQHSFSPQLAPQNRLILDALSFTHRHAR